MKNGTCPSLGVLGLVWGSLVLVPGAHSVVHAQGSPSPATAAAFTLVAVVDLPKVFEGHPTFKSNLEGVQQQLKQVEKEFEAKQADLAKGGKQLSELSPTSADYRRLESGLAQQTADLQVQARQAKKDFLQREAMQYYTVYNEIIAAVNRVAERHNIGLVLRFDSGVIDPSNPQAVAQGIGRSVIVQRNLDITHLVVSELQLAAANSPNRAPRR